MRRHWVGDNGRGVGAYAAGSLEVVMLEARDAYSGPTAQNGGHITPLRHHDYLDLKKKPGGGREEDY